MQRLTNPVPLFLDLRGYLLFGGKIYVGIAFGDPQTHPVPVYWDKGLTNIAAQPLRTMGGMIVNGGNHAFVFLPDGDYSMRVCGNNDVQISYVRSLAEISADPALLAPRHYRFGGFAIEAPRSAEVLVEHIATDAFIIQPDMFGAVASVGSNPTAPWRMTVLLNGQEVGSITISPAGEPTFSTEGQAVPVLAGDVLSFVAPIAPDSSLSRLRFTLKGAL